MSIKREIIIWILVTVSMSLSLFSIFKKESKTEVIKNKVGYVDVTTVFQKFEMKQEMEVKLEASLKVKQSILDSLMFQLQTLNNELKSKTSPKKQDIIKFEELRKQYIGQKETFDNFSSDQSAKYDKQILDQLTQYIKDYGVENQYEFLFGATGDGNILYAPENKDITKAVIVYINNSYQGRN